MGPVAASLKMKTLNDNPYSILHAIPTEAIVVETDRKGFRFRRWTYRKYRNLTNISYFHFITKLLTYSYTLHHSLSPISY